MSIETMKLALATLEKLNKDGWILADFEDDVYASMDALRAAIEQATKPDLAKVGEVGVWGERQWQGLTDEEISAVDWKQNETLHDFAHAIEAKLKEKNNG